MNSIIQLNPTIPLITPKGEGYAHFVIDYGQEHYLKWVVFIDETGECWTYETPLIRISHNHTMGRDTHSPIEKKNNVQTP